ncbi:hypothetical protein V8J88_23465 [Massilia sp. W12]|uniref:hypothetical protein n=1 Tax=Massilia sp. W12 TaxID=3126507 RepID=UPI0030D521F1
MTGIQPAPGLPAEAAPAIEGDALQQHFQTGVAADDIEQIFLLKRAQPVLQAFSALFHGGFEHVLLRLSVLRELAAETESACFTRADINLRLAFLLPDSLETVLSRLRSHQLLAWDAAQSVYRVTPMARNVLAALDGLLRVEQGDDQAEVGFLLSQVAGAQVMGGVSVEQLQHLLARLVDLTEEFRDAIASGSEFRLRSAQVKWHMACDWVEKGSQVIQAITGDPQADSATHRAAQAIGRAQSALLNMQGMFSRALNQIERQRVHLGQSGLSTTDIKLWLLQHDDLAGLADGALSCAVAPLFMTPAEMIDVAETELLSDKHDDGARLGLPDGMDAPVTLAEQDPMARELDDWLGKLASFTDMAGNAPAPVEQALLPANFALASYRASLLPLLGDPNEASLQGPTARLARLPLDLHLQDELQPLAQGEVAAMTRATLSPAARLSALAAELETILASPQEVSDE